MPTYLYEVLHGPKKGMQFEVEQKMSDPPLTEYKQLNGKVIKVRRLIAGGSNFILKGGNWARDSYSSGIQSMPTKEDRANMDKKP